MKELSIEEKAKLYDEAKVCMSRAYNDNRCTIGFMNEIFPELKESEDERVRNKLIEFFKGYSPDEEWWGNITQEDILAWFEKQGKQKTVDEIAKEVCKNKTSAMAFLKSTGIMNEKGELAEQYRQDEQKPSEEYNITGIGSKNAQGKLGEMIKNLKPVNEVLEQGSAWSEEDEKNYDISLKIMCASNKSEELINKLYDWFKSLKDRVQPQPKQKWSDVDKDILFRTIDNLKFLRDTISIDPKYVVNIIDVEREINWLKSLKDRYT